VHILIQWVKLIPKSKFVHYYYQVLDALTQTSDCVLIYEYATCIHEMLKEIDYWIKLSSSGAGGSPLIAPFSAAGSAALRKAGISRGNDLLDFGDTPSDVEDDQIRMSIQIH
jgi:hypothetical protein